MEDDGEFAVWKKRRANVCIDESGGSALFKFPRVEAIVRESQNGVVRAEILCEFDDTVRGSEDLSKRSKKRTFRCLHLHTAPASLASPGNSAPSRGCGRLAIEEPAPAGVDRQRAQCSSWCLPWS